MVSLSKHSLCYIFNTFQTDQTEFFCLGRLFCDSRPLEFSRGTTIAAEIGQAMVDLKVEVEVKLQIVSSHYHCHGRGFKTNPKSGQMESKL